MKPPMNDLSAALVNGFITGNIHLFHHDLGELTVRSGKLVACDPFVCPGTVPFSLRLPQAQFPLTLSIAETGTDQRVAFAILRVADLVPVRWEMMTAPGANPSELKDGEIFGYPVDSGTGCFADATAMSLLDEKMRRDPKYFDTLSVEMDKTYRHTWSWLKVDLGEASLFAFSSGYGDGFYATYAGFDPQGRLSHIVTDFAVLPSAETAATVSDDTASHTGPPTFLTKVKKFLRG